MKQPTEDDIGHPVVNKKTGCVWQIAQDEETKVIGLRTKYRGWRDSVNWDNYEMFERLPLDDEPFVGTPPAGAGGMGT